MFENLLIQSVIESIRVGSLYALMALGITLTVSVLKLPNFAHAEYITVGAYTALIVSLNWSTNPALVLGMAFIITAIVAYGSHRAVFKPMSKHASSIYTMLLASFAVGLILRYILFIIVDIYGLADRQVQVPQRLVMRVGNVPVTNRFFWALIGGVGCMIVLSLLLN
ncbi:MAG: hypothetical protein D6737_17790, partial [Chloroflexi bacterium]